MFRVRADAAEFRRVDHQSGGFQPGVVTGHAVTGEYCGGRVLRLGRGQESSDDQGQKNKSCAHFCYILNAGFSPRSSQSAVMILAFQFLGIYYSGSEGT